MRAMEISRTALDVEWRRMEVIADNLANINTVRTATGEPFRPQQLVSGPRGDFAANLEAGRRNFELQNLAGVETYSIQPMLTSPRVVHEPSNPQADENGDVAYPGVDHALQMTLLVKTTRAYEANVVAMNIARQMYSKGLELGARG